MYQREMNDNGKDIGIIIPKGKYYLYLDPIEKDCGMYNSCLYRYGKIFVSDKIEDLEKIIINYNPKYDKPEIRFTEYDIAIITSKAKLFTYRADFHVDEKTNRALGSPIDDMFNYIKFYKAK
jgi:hypothetical protein